MNDVPIIGKPNEHQLTTAFRKLHLEPNDIIIVRDERLRPDDLAMALNGYSCGHSHFECKGHRLIWAPDGIESCSREMLEELLTNVEPGPPVDPS